ncbi:hypothetical protein [Mycolicibacterium mengxianglii]|uniref:hypothetical protein n=1 Tax=Mycolicibacterium mengxianglii TaxID=2736649 RepID=UPI0018D0D610|nr:hypothetical protein [Mycolicibacterium mengxianglii]
MTAPASVIDHPRETSVATEPPRRYRGGLPLILLLLAAGAFAYSATTMRDAPHTEYGLLASSSPLFLASILLTAFAFTLAVRRASFGVAVLGVLTMIVVQRLPMAIATDSPMYAWVYKHLGVVDYLQHEHMLARGIDVYNGWPGIFGLTAWFCDLTGLSPTMFAQWFTPVWHLLFAALIYAAGRAWDLDRMQAVVATFVAATINWVAQDYFSPQATAMLLAVGVIVVLGHSRQRPVGGWLIVALFAAITITHQLTPFWLLAAIGLLAVTKRLKPWWIFIPLGVILLSYVAYNYGAISGFLDFSGDVVGNAKSNVPTTGSAGQQLTSMAVRVLSGAMWLSAAAILGVRAFRGQPFFALGVLVVSPMFIIVGASYGGEAIFRVFLYSLVGCSIVVAPGLVGLLQGRRIFAVPAVSAVVVAAALAAQGYFGGWFAYLMPRAQVQAVNNALLEADFPAYVSAPVPAWPQRADWRYVDYARFHDWYDHSFIVLDDVFQVRTENGVAYPRLTAMIGERPDASTYLVLTDQMAWYAYYFGVLPLDAVDKVREQALADPFWKLVYDDGDVTVLRHDIELG